MKVDERIDMWVDHLVNELPDMFGNLCVPENERPNIAEVCIGAARAAVRLVLIHAPLKDAPDAMNMLTQYMGNEVQTYMGQVTEEKKESPEIKH